MSMGRYVRAKELNSLGEFTPEQQRRYDELPPHAKQRIDQELELLEASKEEGKYSPQQRNRISDRVRRELASVGLA